MKQIKKCLAVWAVSFIFLPLLAMAPVKKKVLFFGDSITYAGGLPGGYIGMIRQKLAEKGLSDNYELVGKGIGGNKVRDLLARFETDIIDQHPDIVFIMVGINDVGFFTWHPEIGGTPPDEYELALTYMVKRLQEKHASVILCTPTMIEERPDGSNPMDKTLDQYAAIVQKVAAATASAFCNMRKVFVDTLKKINTDNRPKEVLTIDGIHMNEKGNGIIAAALVDYLQGQQSRSLAGGDAGRNDLVRDNAAVAQTPPMGWNSYNCFGSAVHEDEVRANTDYMAAKLKTFGWQYIVVDFLWSYDNPPGSNLGNVSQKRLEDGSFIPWLAMDKWGRLLPDINKFPSAFGGKGFRPLADYVHAAGLKFGIHVMRGIPRQAVWAKAPVLGAEGITADMIADTNSVCVWNNHMYGLDMSKKGAREYLNSILDLYAEWQVDFVKVDDLSRPYSAPEVEGYRQAIDHCGRSMVFSLSPGATPPAQSSHVIRNGNMWRMAEDFWDNWKEIVNMFGLARQWEGFGGPGHWPDCDMLQIGRLSKRGPVGEERYSRFTKDELYSHMTFWIIYRSPLMLGGNLPDNRDLELRLFTNQEVLDVNRFSEDPRQVSDKDSCLVWMSRVPDSKDIYVALFNLSDSTQDLKVDFASLKLKKAKIRVRDLWEEKGLGFFRNNYHRQVAAHGTTLVRLYAN